MKDSYRDLGVWREAIALLAEIHLLMRRFPGHERDLLGEQIFRAAVAVPAKIAEGQQYGDRREFLRLLREAGSRLSELEVLLVTAEQLGCMTPGELESLEEYRANVDKPLRGLVEKVRRDVAILHPGEAPGPS
jgi:four helix bundle protein